MKGKEIKLKKDRRGSVGYAQPESWWERWQDRPYLISLGLAGLVVLGIGVISAAMIANKMVAGEDETVEIEKLEEAEKKDEEIYVDVGGAVMRPGIYQLTEGMRVNDVLIKAGGLAEKADREWITKNINLAQKLTDGIKIYVPFTGETDQDTVLSSQNTAVDLININTASEAELDQLWGVGPATAAKIIEGRPYSSVEELLTKKIVKSNVYEQCKDKVRVY